MTDKNPFLTDIPLVSIATQVRYEDGVAIETPFEDCVRVWGRVNSPQKDEPIIEDNPIRVIPNKNGLTNQHPY